MPAPRPIDPTFLTRPFASSDFVARGYSEKMLRGSRFRRVHHGVWVARSHVMRWEDRLRAAQLALPSAARATGVTRLQLLGIDIGSRRRLHFVIDVDLHLEIDGVVLHRTAQMPPTDDDGVTPAAAFLAYCVTAPLVDAVAVGDWLLHHEHMRVEELHELVDAQPWRRGSSEAAWVLQHLTTKSRSLPESRLRMYCWAAGLSVFEPNALIDARDGGVHEIDLLARRWRLGVEYEGEHHQLDRAQYLKDIRRYRRLRSILLAYTQVTKEHMRTPRAAVVMIFNDLVECGYDGPAPQFDERWDLLFAHVRASIRASSPRSLT